MARIGHGLSQATVGKAVGLSHSTIGRIERGIHPGTTVLQLARICGVVGLDLSIRAFPGGAPLRDAAHVELLRRFYRRLHPLLRFRSEVPLPIVGDLRAWDGMVSSDVDRTAVEAETHVSDAQALTRRIALKQRDGDVARVVLVLSDTAKNRSAIHAAHAVVQDAFPIPARQALAALAAGRHPAGSAIVFL